MQEKDLVIRFYNSIEEEERLEEKHGKIEFDTNWHLRGKDMRWILWSW